MFKTVSTSSLRPGMFLHSLDRRWLHHPFWKSSFLLCADDIVKIMLTDIQSVVIDTEKGLDVEVDASTTYDRSDALDLIEVDLEPLLPVAPGERGQERKRRRSVANEMNHARRLFESACDHMKLVLQDARFGNVISSATMMPLVEAIAASVARSPHALTSVARLKRHDGYTYMHSVAVCALMTALARELKLDEQAVFEAGVAGLMHDVGKALMPLAVLNKPGKLSAEEFEVAKRHAQNGWRLLQSAHVTAGVLEVALHHHERFDGHGYPHGLAGPAIPLLARMGAVCDVYDAVTSNRPYKAAWHPTRALRTMISWDGQFDKTIFAAFVRTIGIYPVGALVRLESGFLAVVLDQNDASLLAPVVKTFFSCRSGQPVLPQVVDLERTKGSERIISIEDPNLWGFSQLPDIWLNHASP